jgi:hypothetical protein
MLEFLGDLNNGAVLSLRVMLANLAAAAALSVLLKWHFIRFGSVIGNRREFARNLPLIVLTTTMIIGIVHSSVALSLGLVGAVSIVRFRTPVKEPEELGYLFLSIAIGFGLGAEQVLLTAVSAAMILAVIAFVKFSWRANETRVMFLSVGGAGGTVDLTSLTAVVAPFARRKDLRRVDVDGASFEAIYSVEMTAMSQAAALLTAVNAAFPGVRVTLIDQNQMPSF